MYTQKISAPCPLYFRGSKQVSTCCMYCIACIALTSMVNAQNFLEWCDECAEESESESRSVCDSLWPHGLYSPWNSPGQNTGVGSLSLLQGIFPTQGSNPDLPHCRRILYQLSHKGSPRILAWVAYPFSSRSSQPRNLSRISCTAGRFFTNWAIGNPRVQKLYADSAKKSISSYSHSQGAGVVVLIQGAGHCCLNGSILWQAEIQFWASGSP